MIQAQHLTGTVEACVSRVLEARVSGGLEHERHVQVDFGLMVA